MYLSKSKIAYVPRSSGNNYNRHHNVLYKGECDIMSGNGNYYRLHNVLYVRKK